MGSSEKKKKSLSVLVGTALFAVLLICVIYFFPYVVANKNANGWFYTGKFAEVNVYPELAIKSYENSIARFPNENSVPMSDIIAVAKKRLNALKQKLTGIDFPKVVKLLAGYKYNDLAKYFASVNVANLKLSFFSVAEKVAVLNSLAVFKKYIGGIQGFYGKDGDSRMFSDKFNYLTITALKKNLRSVIIVAKKQFKGSVVFLKNDMKRLDVIFARCLKSVDDLKVGGSFYATLEKISDLANDWKSDVSKIISNMHIGKIKNVGLVNVKLTKNLQDFTVASREFFKVYNKAGFDIRQMKDLTGSSAKIVKMQKDLMVSFKNYSARYLSVISDAKSFEKATAKKISLLSKLIAKSSELSFFDKAISSLGSSIPVYKKIYANMTLRIKTVKKQRDGATGATKKRLSKLVSSLKKDKRKIELLSGFRENRIQIIDLVLALEQQKSKIMNQFTSESGEINAYGIVNKMATDNYLILSAMIKNVFIADDKKKIILVSVSRDLVEQKKFFLINLVKFSKPIIVKNVALIVSELASGDVNKVHLILNKFKYFSNFEKDYKSKKMYRFDYIKINAGVAVANAKSVADKIMSFRYFYDDNGYLGNRYETQQLNDSILIPAFKVVIAKSGLKDGKYRDLLDDLK